MPSLIEGPKWTGKTTTAEQHAKSAIKLQDTDMANEYISTAAIKPSLLLNGEKPRLIDEWQDAPVIWDAVRTAVDNANGTPGQYILTGSNTVDKTKIRHTGTSRITRMKMYPMSLWESLESSGEISIWDIKAYTADFNSHISYYRDRYGLEADLVLHLEDERYALIECKLSSREIEDGAKHLLEIKRLIQEYNKTEKQAPLREPDLLIVMTGGNMAYTRTDGVKVIPLACLKD